MDDIVVGIDVGTSKICTLVARIENDDTLRVLGIGIEPSEGIRKGQIVDLDGASRAITRSVTAAEDQSGVNSHTALLSLAGGQVSSVNSRGATGVSGQRVTDQDVDRALDAARNVAVPNSREVIHVIQRGFSLDGQDGIQQPVGMHGNRLEVEAHVITAAAATAKNLRTAIGAAGVDVAQFVLNPLASAEVVLSDSERNMGAVVCDIGAGTTDLAIYINGDVWHTMVLPLGGNNITQDIATGLRLPFNLAEDAKKQFGYAVESEIGYDEAFTVQAFGSDKPEKMNRRDLAMIIEARVEEIFDMALLEIKRSGYDGLLPAGMILTGGTSLLPGIKPQAQKVLRMPIRLAQPDDLAGDMSRLRSPAFATSIGLINWAAALQGLSFPSAETVSKTTRQKPSESASGDQLRTFKEFLKRLMP